MQDRILIVENDHAIAEGIAAIASELNCIPVVIRTLEDGVRASALADFQIIVLDRNLPDGERGDTMARIRNGGSSARVLVLSSMGPTANRVEGLENGADDYLAKPFKAEELRLRLRALLRHGAMQLAESDLLAFGDLEIRLTSRTVHVQANQLAVSPKEFDLISYFARHAGKVISRAQLLENVWKLTFDPGTNVVDVHVGRLRRKLEEAGVQAIHTARGQGYVFSPLARQAKAIC